MFYRFIRQFKRFIPIISIGLLVLAIIMAHHEFNYYHISHVRELLLSVPRWIIGKAFLLMIGSYMVATCYDRLALRYINRKLSFGKTLLTAFISFAVSHNVGHSLLSGTSLRYRFYPGWGIKGIDVVKISLVNGITFGLGQFSVLIIACIVAQWIFFEPLPLPRPDLIIGLMIAAYIGYWWCVLFWRPVLTIKGIRFSLPHGRMTLAQFFMGSIDVFLSGMVLYTLLSATLAIPLSEFFIVYITSQLVGSFSQLPGGLGVFEGFFLHLLSAQYPDADILASLLLYRIIYYFIPLSLAGCMLLMYEMKGTHRLPRQNLSHS